MAFVQRAVHYDPLHVVINGPDGPPDFHFSLPTPTLSIDLHKQLIFKFYMN